MAILWQGSLIPWIDANGDPRTGATVYFYDANTTTPQTVYTDSTLGTSAGLSARTADASGMFGAIFLAPGIYRQKVLDADGALIPGTDVDGISVPQTSDYVPPSAGDTDATLLFSTGMLQHWYSTGAKSGWVRANGRTIGSAASAATERANDDTQDLFLFLWTADSSLSVSGGRGASAAADFVANKTIALPDLRGRALVGMDDMGSSAAGIMAGLTSLGAAIGAALHTLLTGELPSHTHTGTTASNGLHGHPFRLSTRVDSGAAQGATGGLMIRADTESNQASYTGTPSATAGQQIGGDGAHTHTFTTDAAGSGTAFSVVQPGTGVTIYLKL